MGSRSPGRGADGFALVVVLFVTAVLMIVVLQFAHSMQVYATIGANGASDVRLRGALHAGLAVAEYLLLEDLRADAEHAVTMDHLEENWALDIPTVRLAGAEADVWIEDEVGKFPLATLVAYQVEDGAIVDSQVDPERRRQLAILFEELEIAPELVDVVVDWLDVDDDPEASGAETADYAAFDRVCRNGPFASIDELELLLGVTHAMVWGDEDHLGLADVCTVQAPRDGRVNANTAPEPVLLALLPEEDLARRIVSERDRDPFVDSADLNDRVGDTRAGSLLTTASGLWRVRVTAQTDHQQRPLTLEARGLLRRAPPEEGEDRAADTLADGTPGRAAAASGALASQAPRAVVEVVAWKESR